VFIRTMSILKTAGATKFIWNSFRKDPTLVKMRRLLIGFDKGTTQSVSLGRIVFELSSAII
jgi:hypothetical protein